MTARNSSFAFAALCAGAWALSVFCLESGTSARWQLQPIAAPLSRPLPPQLTRFSLMAALGDHARVAADWAYIDCLQYLGNNLNVQDGRFRQTEALYREVLWLDPGFHHAVREGGSVLGWNQRRVDAALNYLQDAIRFDPSHQRLHLYLAALAYAKVDDPVKVVEALRPELVRPDAPEMLLRIVGNIYLKEKDWDDAIRYWTWVKSRALDPLTQAAADEALRMAHNKISVKRKIP
jgi:tetratricopeptide (TPR) repeat protein